jgi:uncharacterized protein (DUF433 family)
LKSISPDLDPREAPNYGFGEASHYLGVPISTLRAWTRGQSYRVTGGRRRFANPLALPDPDRARMSFYNLVEAHVLASLRRNHKVSLANVRRALEHLSKTSGLAHPLATAQFATDGVDLFIEQYGHLVNLSRGGQMAIKAVLERYLQRIEHDRDGLAFRLYPFTRAEGFEQPRIVVIDPGVSFGRPVLVGTGIPTSAIADRFKAGETIEALAKDYGRHTEEIQEALRCERYAA